MRRLARLGMIAVFAGAVACGRGSERGRTESAGAETAPAAEPVAPESSQSQIVLLFPGVNDELLHAERRTVVPIEAAEDRAKLCLEELFRGPRPGLLAAVPDGVRVKEVYILEDGTAYADLTSDVIGKLNGTTREMLAVYAIVDTLAINFPALKRVGLLVDGAVQESLGGHLYTGRPLLPDFQLVEASARPRSADGAGPGARPGGAAGNGGDGTKGGEGRDGKASASPDGSQGSSGDSGNPGDADGDASGKAPHRERPDGDGSGAASPGAKDPQAPSAPAPPAGDPV